MIKFKPEDTYDALLIQARALHSIAQSEENQILTNEIEHLHRRINELELAITKTIEENLHLADGDSCTLIDLKRIISVVRVQK